MTNGKCQDGTDNQREMYVTQREKDMEDRMGGGGDHFD